MRMFLALSLTTFIAACNTSTETHVSAYSLEACIPDGSYMPKQNKGNGPTNDKCQGTTNGDNCDDLSSGKVDCIGDGNSGQGDDKKHNCMFPQPGCDENGCCDEDVVDPGDGGDGGGTGTGSGSGDGDGTGSGDGDGTGSGSGDGEGDGTGTGSGSGSGSDDPIVY